MPVVPPNRTSRRTAMGAGLLVLAGCTVDSGPSARSSSTPATPSDQGYDQRLVDQVASATQQALSTIERMSARYHRLTEPLAALVALHHAHLSALQVVSAPATSPVPLQGDVTRALADLLSLEQALQEDLSAAAGNALSGQLARVLAGMAAGVAQQVVVLSRIGDAP